MLLPVFVFVVYMFNTSVKRKLYDLSVSQIKQHGDFTSFSLHDTFEMFLF